MAEIVDVLARNMEGDATRLSSVRCVGYFSKHVKGDVRERAEVRAEGRKRAEVRSGERRARSGRSEKFV